MRARHCNPVPCTWLALNKYVWFDFLSMKIGKPKRGKSSTVREVALQITEARMDFLENGTGTTLKE